MAAESTFADHAVVACGTLRGELEVLHEQGFLDAEPILFTAPGLHEDPKELERQLTRQLGKVTDAPQGVIAVYGAKCFVDHNDPFREWDSGKANETFPQDERAVLLDGIGFFQQYSEEKPEEVLALSDWMKIPIQPVSVFLDRLCKLLLQAVQ